MRRTCRSYTSFLCGATRSSLNSRVRASLIVLVVYAAVFELVVYRIHTSYVWPQVYKHQSQLRALLVADPHFRSPTVYRTALARWDVERFLRATFRAAMEHVTPHMVVFLGDMWREAGVEKTSVWHLGQFLRVFGDADRVIDVLVLPGERDVGRDQDEPAVANASMAFVRMYRCPSVLLREKYEFVVYNSLYRESRNLAKNLSAAQNGAVRILLSHLPVLPMLDTRINRTLRHVRPNVIFSAHERASFLVRAPKSSPEAFSTIKNFEPAFGIGRYMLDEEGLLEFIVPSSAYDVTSSPGYSVAIFSGDMMLDYAVLWTPARAVHIYGYVVIIIYCALLFSPVFHPLGYIWVRCIGRCLATR